jgi:TonB family protein
MTLWLANLAAYSVQLGVLVASAAVVMACLRVDSPRAAMRFWQALLAACVLLPAGQVWWSIADTTRTVYAAGVLWRAASNTGFGGPLAAQAPASTVATWIVAALGAGVAIRLAWLGLGLITLRAIRARSQPADVLSPLSAALQDELGVKADVRFSDAISSPATIGRLRPIVLLPHEVRDLAPAVQRAVLCHELMHVRQRDWTTALVEELWCAILWFHPAARALASRIALAREMLVDQATIAHTRNRQAYAAALLAFAAPPSRLLGVTALIGRRHLEQRIARIAQEVPMPGPFLALRMAVATTAVAMATLAATSYIPLGATLQAQAGQVYKPGHFGLTLPSVLTEVKPTYTPAAMRARLEGTIWMQAVVLANGRVGDVTVVRSLDKEHGLDQQAVDATRQWSFEPGRLAGKPVPVEVTMEMRFTLRK